MSDENLVNNLLLTFQDNVEGLSNITKERILKERIALHLDKIIEYLNEVYGDVHFYAQWASSAFEDGMNRDGHSIKSGFDEHQQDDMTYWNDFDDEDEDQFWGLSDKDLNELSIKVNYIHSVKCNLGHVHKYKRFYYYSMPKIMQMISYYLITPHWKEGIVKEYIPNFFDVEPKNPCTP